MVMVSVHKPGESWERHVVAKWNLDRFLAAMEKQGYKCRLPSGR